MATWKESIQCCSVLRTSIWGEVQDVDSRMALQEMQAIWLYPGDSCPVSCTHLSIPLGHSWLKLWFNLICSKMEVNILVSFWVQYDLDCTKLKFVEEMVKAISLHQSKVLTDWWMLSQHPQNPSMVPCDHPALTVALFIPTDLTYILNLWKIITAACQRIPITIVTI